jgi:hypothetical protein
MQRFPHGAKTCLRARDHAMPFRPSIPSREFAEVGGLMTTGPISPVRLTHILAGILKGAKPLRSCGDLRDRIGKLTWPSGHFAVVKSLRSLQPTRSFGNACSRSWWRFGGNVGGLGTRLSTISDGPAPEGTASACTPEALAPEGPPHVVRRKNLASARRADAVTSTKLRRCPKKAVSQRVIRALGKRQHAVAGCAEAGHAIQVELVRATMRARLRRAVFARTSTHLRANELI